MAKKTWEATRIAQIIGDDLTLRLIEEHGGARVYVSRNAPGPDSALRFLGADLLAALYEEFGPGTFRVPLARSWRAQVYHERGMTYPQIARKLVVSECTAWRYVDNAKPLPAKSKAAA